MQLTHTNIKEHLSHGISESLILLLILTLKLINTKLIFD